jgi:hypothetical protein
VARSPVGASALLWALCLTSFLARAQQDRGVFTGQITDPAGLAMHGVAVAAGNGPTNRRYETRTNPLGQYTLPNLPAGVYRISFEAPGFKRLVWNGWALEASQIKRADVRMELGDQSVSVEVRELAPLLQTESAEVGTGVERSVATELPLGIVGGRYPEDFAYRLVPGV